MWWFIMKRDKSRKRMDSDHLQVANPIRPEDLDRHVTRHGIYPSLPASQGVPWSTYVRSQRVSSRSVSSSTEALDSDQARQTTCEESCNIQGLCQLTPLFLMYLQLTESIDQIVVLVNRYTTKNT